MMVSVGQGRKGRGKTNQNTLFPDPATESEMVSCLRTVKVKSNARFPCTHKKEPVDFQSLNTLP